MKEEIKKIFRGDVEDSAEMLKIYSRDASIFEVKPKLVLFPRDKEDVKNLVRWVGEYKQLSEHPGNPGANISITARCAGTDMSGGPLNESIILDFTRYMNRLVGGPLPLPSLSSPPKLGGEGVARGGIYPVVPSYISVEPGMMYRDFEKITLAKGLILPCFTASKSINAMGGMFGNNSAGERTLKHGQMQSHILSSKVVLADGNEYEVRPLSRGELEKKIAQNDFEGEIYKKIFNLIQERGEEIRHAKPNVRKNSAGYYIWNVFNDNIFDLNKLLVGSQGTLGIVTEMTLKIIPEDKHSKLAIVFTNDLDSLGRLVDEILTLKPESLETYDDKTMKLAVRFFPDFLKSKGWLKMLKFLWSFMPEFKMLLTGGFPKLILLIEFRGENEKALDIKCKQLVKNLSAKGGPALGWKLKIHITESETEAEKYWDIRRESFSLLRKHVKNMRTAPFIDDIIVRPEFLPKFLPELNKLLDQYKNNLTYTLAGHAGDGNFHIIPLMDFKRPDTGKIIFELGDKVYDLILRFGGSITAEHNDGLIRTPFLAKMYGEQTVGIFKKIKEIFDPQNLFNPGKKVPLENNGQALAGSKTYAVQHLALEHNAKHAS